jgi:hypothetical protein
MPYHWLMPFELAGMPHPVPDMVALRNGDPLDGIHRVTALNPQNHDQIGPEIHAFCDSAFSNEEHFTTGWHSEL